MSRLLSLVLLLTGLVLIVASAGDGLSPGTMLKRFFSGLPTDRSIWFLLAGAISAVIGAKGLFGRSKRT